MQAVLLEKSEYPCPYISGQRTIMEQFLVSKVTPEEHEILLAYGYRHFGAYYFRPACGSCTACVPVRIGAEPPESRRSWRRVLNKASDLQISFDEIPDTAEAFRLYTNHKKRFDDTESSSIEVFRESFFAPHPAAGILTIRDGDTLVCVSHFDRTGESLSAVYTYYNDTDYGWASPGKLAVLKLLQAAVRENLERVYLGFYVHGNRSMAYKAGYSPLEYSPFGGVWLPPDKPLEELSFIPGDSILSGS